MFKIKNGYETELETPEIMKLFGSTKKLLDKTKNGEKVIKWNYQNIYGSIWYIVRNRR